MPNNSRGSNKEKKGRDYFFIALIVYFIFEYLRPQGTVLPFLSILKVSMWMTLIILVAHFKSEQKLFHDKLAVLAVLFLVEMAVSVTYAVNTYFVWRGFKGMALMLIIALAMPIIVNNLQKFKKFLDIWIIIHILLALYMILHGGRGPSGFLSDENDAALAMNMAVPIAAILIFQKDNTKKQKIFYALATFLFMASVVATTSRGGFLGLSSIIFAFWWLSNNKFSMLMKAMLIAAILAYPVYKMLPEKYVSEVESISDTKDSTRNSRLKYWSIGWDMFLDNPIIGVGALNYRWNVVRYQVIRDDFDENARLLGGRAAHSLYFTLFAELGLLGTFFYFYIIYTVIKKLRRIIRLGNDNVRYRNSGLMATGLLVSMGSFLVTGTFISVLYYPPFWYLIGFVMALDVSVKKMELEAGDNNVVKKCGKDRFSKNMYMSKARS